MLGRWTVLVGLALAAALDKRQEFAAVPWNSPLRGHLMNTVCPMQDEYLERKDLSALHLPVWLRNHEDPVGRCPVKFYPLMDEKRIWPPVLIAVECACESACELKNNLPIYWLKDNWHDSHVSRCTMRGSHVCITVYITRSVLKQGVGFTKELLSVDCICAARRAKLIKFTRPKMVS